MLQFLVRLSQSLAETVYAPVVVGIFECACDALAVLVARHIAEAVVLLESETARRRHLGMDGVGSVLHRFPKRLGIISAQAFEISVCHYGRRVVAYHAAPVSRTRPLGQESALLIGVDESFLHLLVHRGIHQVEEGE